MAGAPNSPLGVASGFMSDPNTTQWGQQSQQANQFGKSFGLDQQRFGLQQQGQNQQYGLEKQQLDQRQANRNQAFGLLSRQLGSAAPGAAGSVPVGPIWTQSQIANKEHLANAGAWGGEENQENREAQHLASSGFGANSPVQMALAAQGQQGTRGSNFGNNTNFDFTAAQGNAEHEQQGAIANAQLAQSNAALQANRQTSIMQALAGLS